MLFIVNAKVARALHGNIRKGNIFNLIVGFEKFFQKWIHIALMGIV